MWVVVVGEQRRGRRPLLAGSTRTCSRHTPTPPQQPRERGRGHGPLKIIDIIYITNIIFYMRGIYTPHSVAIHTYFLTSLPCMMMLKVKFVHSTHKFSYHLHVTVQNLVELFVLLYLHESWHL